jgi:hypothetical protein
MSKPCSISSRIHSLFSKSHLQLSIKQALCRLKENLALCKECMLTIGLTYSMHLITWSIGNRKLRKWTKQIIFRHWWFKTINQICFVHEVDYRPNLGILNPFFLMDGESQNHISTSSPINEIDNWLLKGSEHKFVLSSDLYYIHITEFISSGHAGYRCTI